MQKKKTNIFLSKQVFSSRVQMLSFFICFSKEDFSQKKKKRDQLLKFHEKRKTIVFKLVL